MHGTLYAQFILARLRAQWHLQDRDEQVEHVNGFQYLLTRYPPVRVDQYRPAAGFEGDLDFMLRCESDNPEALRDLVLELRGSDLWTCVETARTLTGRTREPQYASERQLKELARTRVAPDLKRHAFVLTIRRTADWDRFPYADRQRMVQEHIEAELPFNDDLHRRCYYCDGLDPQQDYVYYLEARDAGVAEAAYAQARRLRDANYWASHAVAFRGIPVTLEEWSEQLLRPAYPAGEPQPGADAPGPRPAGSAGP